MFQLAEKLNNTGGHHTENAKFLLLIASLLRKFTVDELNRVDVMLRVNIQDSTFLRRVYDDGYDENHSVLILEEIDSVLIDNEIILSDPQREYISALGPRELLKILVAASAGDVATLMILVSPPESGLLLSLDGG